ncbi:VOC family protein [Gracilimonas sp.]|uniref:VOC family protein n=1 Tax=Gracilimonas sp. TaxID=1974203 RepID=UPI0032EC1E7A
MKVFWILLLPGLFQSIDVYSQEVQKHNNQKDVAHQSIGTLRSMTIAAHDMPEMIEFYTEVYNVEFSEKIINEFTLFEGKWLGYNLLVCPAEFAQNTAQQTRHQLDISVTDFDAFIEKVEQFGGSLLGEVIIQEGVRSVGIHDPDKNSMIIIESLN